MGNITEQYMMADENLYGVYYANDDISPGFFVAKGSAIYRTADHPGAAETKIIVTGLTKDAAIALADQKNKSNGLTPTFDILGESKMTEAKNTPCEAKMGPHYCGLPVVENNLCKQHLKEGVKRARFDNRNYTPVILGKKQLIEGMTCPKCGGKKGGSTILCTKCADKATKKEAKLREEAECEFTQLDDSEWYCGVHQCTMVGKQEPVKCSAAWDEDDRARATAGNSVKVGEAKLREDYDLGVCKNCGASKEAHPGGSDDELVCKKYVEIPSHDFTLTMQKNFKDTGNTNILGTKNEATVKEDFGPGGASAGFGLPLEYRPFKCTVCGNEQKIQTNHTGGEVYNYCTNCSWKGVGFGPGVAYGQNTAYRKFVYAGANYIGNESVKEAGDKKMFKCQECGKVLPESARKCSKCGSEDIDLNTEGVSYDKLINALTEDEEGEPEEDDITTEDHEHWYMSGKLYFTGSPAELRAQMEKDGYWPNCWFISDHGNSHLISDFTEASTNDLNASATSGAYPSAPFGSTLDPSGKRHQSPYICARCGADDPNFVVYGDTPLCRRCFDRAETYKTSYESIKEASAFSYILVIKGNGEACEAALVKHLGYTGLNGRFVTASASDCTYKVYSDTDLINTLNSWMGEDQHIGAPYPVGSLLFWNPGKASEAKLKESDDNEIGLGFYLNKTGYDSNGNWCAWVARGSNTAKRIQTNGNCPTAHSARSVDAIMASDAAKKELVDYYKKYILKEGASQNGSFAPSGNGSCDCGDRGCPVHPGSERCPNAATTTVFRIDMNDPYGSEMCDGCAADAMDSGVFTMKEAKKKLKEWMIPDRQEEFLKHDCDMLQNGTCSQCWEIQDAMDGKRCMNCGSAFTPYGGILCPACDKQFEAITKEEKAKLTEADGLYGYIARWRGKTLEIYSDTLYHAQQAAAKQFGAKKEYEVTVMLAERPDGTPVIHTPTESKVKEGYDDMDKVVSSGACNCTYYDCQHSKSLLPCRLPATTEVMYLEDGNHIKCCSTCADEMLKDDYFVQESKGQKHDTAKAINEAKLVVTEAFYLHVTPEMEYTPGRGWHVPDVPTGKWVLDHSSLPSPWSGGGQMLMVGTKDEVMKAANNTAGPGTTLKVWDIESEWPTNRAGMPESKAKLTEAEWGFDLTDISPSDWQRVLKEVGASSTATVVKHDFGGGWYTMFRWAGPGIEIFTKNNPITGEASTDSNGAHRDPEVGYASYIGMTGEQWAIFKASRLIRRLGSVKGESPNSRDFI